VGGPSLFAGQSHSRERSDSCLLKLCRGALSEVAITDIRAHVVGKGSWCESDGRSPGCVSWMYLSQGGASSFGLAGLT